MWRADKRPTFLKQYGRLGSARQQKVDSALRELVVAENPADLGEYKSSMKSFAYELSKGDRIIFDVDYSNNMIIFLRVCDHKSVYGRD
jgi:mRNA-degrading endonuclease RelE of RelBE toxin-antitoxin system